MQYGIVLFNPALYMAAFAPPENPQSEIFFSSSVYSFFRKFSSTEKLLLIKLKSVLLEELLLPINIIPNSSDKFLYMLTRSCPLPCGSKKINANRASFFFFGR